MKIIEKALIRGAPLYNCNQISACSQIYQFCLAEIIEKFDQVEVFEGPSNANIRKFKKEQNEVKNDLVAMATLIEIFLEIKDSVIANITNYITRSRRITRY